MVSLLSVAAVSLGSIVVAIVIVTGVVATMGIIRSIARDVRR